MRRCPVCQDTLARRTLSDTLEVEGCTSCGGIWLTNGQLKQAASSAEQLISLDESFPVSAIALNNGARHVCPDCLVPMSPIEYDRFPGIQLDNCPRCDGLWLTHGQATAIANVLFPPEPTAAGVYSPGESQRNRSQALSCPLDGAIATSDTMQIRQRRELLEAFMGIETRNRYTILDAVGSSIGDAEEPSGGWSGVLFRNFLGHWRDFTIEIYDNAQGHVYTLHHPFCWWLSTIDLVDRNDMLLGRVCQRFSLIARRFDIQDYDGNVILTVNAPIWHPWTFTFTRPDGTEVATIYKRFPGLFSFLFTDRDDFQIKFTGDLSFDERRLILFAGLFIDLSYFERKAGR